MSHGKIYFSQEGELEMNRLVGAEIINEYATNLQWRSFEIRRPGD